MLASLPPELVLRVVASLPLRAVAALSQTSRALLALCRGADVWRPVCQRYLARAALIATPPPLLADDDLDDDLDAQLAPWQRHEHGRGVTGWYELATRFLIPHHPHLGWHASSRPYQGRLLLTTLDPVDGCIVAHEVRVVNAYDRSQWAPHPPPPPPLPPPPAPAPARVRPPTPPLPPGAVLEPSGDAYVLPPAHPSPERSFIIDLYAPRYLVTPLFRIRPCRVGARLTNPVGEDGMRLDIQWESQRITPLDSVNASRTRSTSTTSASTATSLVPSENRRLWMIRGTRWRGGEPSFPNRRVFQSGALRSQRDWKGESPCEDFEEWFDYGANRSFARADKGKAKATAQSDEVARPPFLTLQRDQVVDGSLVSNAFTLYPHISSTPSESNNAASGSIHAHNIIYQTPPPPPRLHDTVIHFHDSSTRVSSSSTPPLQEQGDNAEQTESQHRNMLPETYFALSIPLPHPITTSSQAQPPLPPFDVAHDPHELSWVHALSLEGLWSGSYGPHGCEFGFVSLSLRHVTCHLADEVEHLVDPLGSLSFGGGSGEMSQDWGLDEEVGGDEDDTVNSHDWSSRSGGGGPVGSSKQSQRWVLEYTKITGDPNVPRGAPSWMVYLPLDSSSEECKSEVKVVTVDDVEIQRWDQGDVEFRRWTKCNLSARGRVAFTGYSQPRWAIAEATFVQSTTPSLLQSQVECGDDGVVFFDFIRSEARATTALKRRVDEIRLRWNELERTTVYRRVVQ